MCRAVSYLAAAALLLAVGATSANDAAELEAMPAQEPEVTPALAVDVPDIWREGEAFVLRVIAPNPDVYSVAAYVEAARIPIGGKSRGKFTDILFSPIPVQLAVDGTIREHSESIIPPFYDAARLVLNVKAFDSAGQTLEKLQVPVSYLPSVVPANLDTGVVVSRSRQRLYGLQDGMVRYAYVVSTGRTHSDGGGPTPLMETRIRNKHRSAYSKKYDVWMHYWNAITSDGRYGIHATYPNMYSRLGRPDSHGCVRLHKTDAQEFYGAFPVGTPVYVVE